MENENKNVDEKESEKPEEKEVESTPKKEKKPINLAKGGLIWSIWNFLEAALILTLGIICFVFMAKASTKDDINKVISVIMMIGGIFLVVGGALKIIANFMPVVARNVVDAAVKTAIKSQLSYDLVIGGTLELAIGVAFIVSYSKLSGLADLIATFLAVFIGVLVIVAGASLVLFAIGFIVSKLYKIYLPIIEIVFGAALVALGIVVICCLSGDTLLTMQISLIVLGIILVLAGLAMAVMTVVEINKARAKKALLNVAKAAVTENIDVEVVDDTEKDKE